VQILYAGRVRQIAADSLGSTVEYHSGKQHDLLVG
jgi:hypothetical protein